MQTRRGATRPHVASNGGRIRHRPPLTACQGLRSIAQTPVPRPATTTEEKRMAETTLTHDQEQTIEWLEERQGRFIQMADEIWGNPELALAEFKACKLQSDDLAAEGFAITK